MKMQNKKPRQNIYFAYGFFALLIVCLINPEVIGLIAILTICTLGIGGGVIFLVLNLVGSTEYSIIRLIYFLFFEKNKSEIFRDKYIKKCDINQDLLRYIKETSSRNFSYNTIRNNLLSSGWSEQDISVAMKTAMVNPKLFNQSLIII